MKHKVIKSFRDQETNSVYHPGDVYPANGYVVTDDRMQYLSSAKNKLKAPVIAPIKATKQADTPVESR